LSHFGKDKFKISILDTCFSDLSHHSLSYSHQDTSLYDKADGAKVEQCYIIQKRFSPKPIKAA